MTNEEMKAELARLTKENEDLKATKQAAPPISFKVGTKGGLSVYGLGRFPMTLYRSQWERLLDHSDGIRGAIEANADKLTTKE